MNPSKKQSVKPGHQLDGEFGEFVVGDTVTVVANRKTDAENKVSTLSLQTFLNSVKLNLKLYICK